MFMLGGIRLEAWVSLFLAAGVVAPPASSTTTTGRSHLTERADTRSFSLRVDWLLAWQSDPGSLLFPGYGNAAEPDLITIGDVFGRRDGVSETLFIKASYVWRP